MIEDKDLLILFRDDKTKDKGFTLLMNKYKQRIYWHIRRIVVSKEDTEDILQETFINAYRYLGSFKNESSIYTWLYRVATNECSKMFRNRKMLTSSYDAIGDTLINKLYQETDIDSDEILLKFQEAILRLSEKQRLVFNLRYYDELSYQEIADITGQSVATLKTNYHYASEKVKEYMLK